MVFDVEALLFDIDGTLVDSTVVVERTWRKWAAAHDLEPEAILRVCHGRRSEDTIAEFLPREQVAEALAEHEALELGDLDDIVALPSASELLRHVHPSRWAAVTSGPRSLMQARLTAAALPVPKVLICAGDVRAGKPDPQGYLMAAQRLGTPIERCLVIEDAPAGIRAGRAAGARVLAVATSHSAGELNRADAVVTDLRACRVEPTPTGVRLHADERAPNEPMT